MDHVHADRAAYETAAALIDDFGEQAGLEAAARAERSRHLGNVIHFCRWRQIGRAIDMLAPSEARGTIH